MIIVNIINNLPFCGQQGLGQGSASSALYATGLGFSNDEKMRYLWLVALVVILCVAAMFLFVRSKYGRAIRPSGTMRSPPPPPASTSTTTRC